MMMESLEAGGMDCVKSERRRMVNEHHRDGVYTPNPNDLYEPDFRRWGLTEARKHDGRLIKVVAPNIDILCVHDYKVVYLLRDTLEIQQSFYAAFGKEHPIKSIDESIKESLAVLRNRRDVQLITMNYTDVLDDPKKCLSRLDWPFDIDKAVQIVDPKHYRFQADRLVA